MMTRIACLLVLLLAAAPARAAKPDQSQEQQLVIHPASIPPDPLKYRLLPAAEDQTPGNAATVYLSTFALSGELNADKNFQELQNLPSDAPVGPGAAHLWDGHPRISRGLQTAGRRAWCVWEPPIREEGLDFQAPYLNDARVLAYFASIAARSAIERHDYGRAVLALQAGFALADNLDRDPFVIQAMSALEVQSLMLDSLRLYVQQPDAPNLYWALANMPPLDRQCGRMFQIETASLFFMFPELKEARSLSASQAGSVLERFWRLDGHNQTGQKAAMILYIVHEYPLARKLLLDTGMPSAEVDMVPANAAVLALWVDDYRKQTDNFGKWAGLPVWQALVGFRAASRELAEHRSEENPLMLLVPAYSRIIARFGQVRRDAAMLQTVEAIRAYASAHRGNVPRSLDELSPDTPVPLDPLSGKPFEYQGSGKSAVLRSSAPPGEMRDLERIFHVTVSK